MARDLRMKIGVCNSADGRVRLTTRGGVVLDATVLRWEFTPKTVLLIQPLGFTVTFGDHTPELLRIPISQLADAARVTDPPAVPDVEKLRKALEWPGELPPRTSAAIIKRAEKALADAVDVPAAVQLAVEAGVTRGLPAAVVRLDLDTRRRMIHLAADIGAGDVLRVLLPSVADVPDIDVPLLLARAAARGKIHSIAALLDAGADPEAVVFHSFDRPRMSGFKYALGAEHTPLHWAVASGQRGAVRQLLQAGARVTDAAGLACAAAESPDPVVWSLLLAAGLDVDARDFRGDPLLLVLGRAGCDALFTATIAAGADVNATYSDGSTLLLHAVDLATRKEPSTFFIKSLLAAGADSNIGRLHGRSALALARVVPHDPGAHNRERWIAGWLLAAGAVAAEDPDAPPIQPRQDPPPPAWRARIDPAVVRAPHQEALGVRFLLTTAACELAPTRTPAPRWTGLGSDDIAVARAKLEHMFGPPPDRGDNYKTTFEYTFTATANDTTLGLRILDWKARELALAVEPHPDEALRDRVAAAFWELLIISPLAAFRDRFRFDEYAGRAYHSDGRTASAEFPR